MGNRPSHIEHIVVLMLENRSYDSLLGWQSGLAKDLFNTDEDGQPVYVWGDAEGDGDLTLPTPDPGESFTDINYQLFESYFPAAGAEPTMGGFVRNYYHQTVATGERYDPRGIMHCFRPGQVPVTSELARSFAVSDRWFASAPCQTWPNRFFVHAATADGYVNNAPRNPFGLLKRFPYEMPTIFEELHRNRQSWRIYFHDFAQALLMSNLWPYLDRFRPFHSFVKQVECGDLAAYTFIEPRYLTDKRHGRIANDQHPPHNVLYGEQLIAQVYNALRANEDLWLRTFLIVIWDEHGGCYDHVAPGPAQAPCDGRSPKPDQYGFVFDRFGVRVPALLISPYVPPRTVHRPEGPIPFDHTSVIKTLRQEFRLEGGPLTRRDAVAPGLGDVLALDPDHLNLGPPRIDPPVREPSAEELEQAAAAPLNAHQAALHIAAAALPPRGRFKRCLTALSRRVLRSAAAGHGSSEEALPWIRETINDFFDRDVTEPPP